LEKIRIADDLKKEVKELKEQIKKKDEEIKRLQVDNVITTHNMINCFSHIFKGRKADINQSSS